MNNNSYAPDPDATPANTSETQKISQVPPAPPAEVNHNDTAVLGLEQYAPQSHAPQSHAPQSHAPQAYSAPVPQSQPASAQSAHSATNMTQPIPTQPQVSSQSPYAAPNHTQHGQSNAFGMSAPQAPAPTGKQKNKTPRTKTAIAPLIAATLASALLASGGTAALLGAFSDDDTPAAVSASQEPKTDSTTTAPVTNSTSENPNWEAVTNAVADSVVAIEVTTQSGGGQGSGVIISTDGYILTNNHVVEGATDNKVQVILNDGRIFTADITGLDAATDLAVIKLEGNPTSLVAASLADSDSVTVGSSVLAMGNPLGLSQTATTGIVSALDRPVSTAQTSDGTQVVTNAIQIDAAINPGNSGGPLFNAQGQVIGITSSIASLGTTSSGTSGSIGLGFAIPSNLAKNISDQLIANGTAKHAFLGVSLKDGTATANGDTRKGAEVGQVTQGSAADEAGVKAGDVIVSIDSKAVTGAESLTGFVREHEAGDVVTLGVVRDGTLIELTATLATKTEQATANPDDSNSGSGSGSGSDSQGSQGNSDGSGSSDGSQGRGQMPGSGQLPGNMSLEDLQKLLEQYGQNGLGN